MFRSLLLCFFVADMNVDLFTQVLPIYLFIFTLIAVDERFKPISQRSVTFGFALHENIATNAVAVVAATATNVQCIQFRFENVHNLSQHLK